MMRPIERFRRIEPILTRHGRICRGLVDRMWAAANVPDVARVREIERRLNVMSRRWDRLFEAWTD